MAGVKKLTIKQKADERHAKRAQAPTKVVVGDRIDKIIAEVNKKLGGIGRVHRGSHIQDRSYERRSSGIPAVDYITCGGYPKGGLVEIGGEYSTGKTRAAIEACAHEQRTTRGACAFIALEPFSKRWSRECGFFIPFSEALAPDPETGEMKPIDPFEKASALELRQMELAGITDPYTEVSPFILIQDWRGDAALDAAIDLLKSNEFAIIVVDSLGVAKSTKWVEEKEVQDSGDFPREAKMIGDYTTRALLALNTRYDENNQISNDGYKFNETTLIHLNHITTVVNTNARAKHKTQSIKGGEGNKHNHHFIMFLYKGEVKQIEQSGRPTYKYAQEVKCMGLKSKLGPMFLESEYDFYLQPFGTFQTGEIDKVKSLVSLSLIAGTIDKAGAWLSLDEEHFKFQGREKFEDALRQQPDWYNYLSETTRLALKR